MRTEKIAVRMEPKDAQALRKIARKNNYETLSMWLRVLLKAEINKHARRSE
jgi:hypothetical protein